MLVDDASRALSLSFVVTKDIASEAPRRSVLQSGMPFHRQLTQILNGRIENAIYLPGQLIPSEAKLCQEFGVSRITVRKSLADLADRGLVRRYRGRGTEVSPSFEPFGPAASTGNLEDITIFFSATEVTRSERTWESPPAEVQARLGLSAGTSVAVITRWFQLNGEPFSLARTYLQKSLSDHITDASLSSPNLVEFLAGQLGVTVLGARQILWATVADSAMAAHLAVHPGDAVLGLSLAYYAADRLPIAISQASIRGDRYHHHVRLGQTPPAPPSGPSIK